MATNTTTVTSTGKSNDSAMLTFPPIVHLIWGIALLIGNIAGNMMQVQSTQAWILGTGGSWTLSVSLWTQWALFFSGKMDAPHIVAFIASWGAQFVLMTSKIGTVFITANIVAKHSQAAHRVERVISEGSFRLGVWNFLAWGIIIFDSATDWNFSASVGFWQQLFFCAVTFLATFYFGTWGILNIVAGLNRMKKD